MLKKPCCIAHIPMEYLATSTHDDNKKITLYSFITPTYHLHWHLYSFVTAACMVTLFKMIFLEYNHTINHFAILTMGSTMPSL